MTVDYLRREPPATPVLIQRLAARIGWPLPACTENTLLDQDGGRLASTPKPSKHSSRWTPQPGDSQPRLGDSQSSYSSMARMYKSFPGSAVSRRIVGWARRRRKWRARVSSDFGELAVSRHLISGVDCAMAGLAIEMALAPATALRNWRRFIMILRC
jgi:hypothetical protein